MRSAVATLALLLTTASAHALEAEELVFLAEYIGGDYGLAVQRGAVADPFEFEEMVAFSGRLRHEWSGRPEAAKHPEIGKAIGDLQETIRTLGTWDDVRRLAETLAVDLAGAMQVRIAPAHRPNPDEGGRIYQTHCASCHGAEGAGDGPSSVGQKPPPTSFRATRTNLLSPHQMYAATRFGIDGTAMTAFGDVLSSTQLWDIAFYLQTVRENFTPDTDVARADVPLRDLALFSNVALREKTGLPLGALDRLRLNPPAPTRPGDDTGTGPPDDRATGATGPTSALDLALGLEDAFMAISDAHQRSVVGVASYRRTDGATKHSPTRWDSRESQSDSSSAIAGATDDIARDGYEVFGVASGYFVSSDGFVLTRHGPLVAPDGTQADRVEIRTHDDHSYPARLVGAEPSIDLAVLRVLVPFETPAMEPADPTFVRPGRWAILLGDPPGVTRTFSPGNISAVPVRQCYQEARGGTLFQTSLRTTQPNFGGPVVDIRGRTIGMAVPPIAAVGDDAPVLVLPSKLATTVYEALRVAESKKSPWLGFSVLELSRKLRQRAGRAPRTGVYIDAVFREGPADRAGVEVGDVLTQMNGEKIVSVGDFQKWLYLSGIGATVELQLSRAGEKIRVPVVIEERPAEAAMTDG